MSNWRIGALTQNLFLSILALLAGLLFYDIAGLLSERNESARTVGVSKAGQELFAALQTIRTERGRLRVALQGPPATQATIDDIAKARQAATPALERFFALCRDVECASANDIAALRDANNALDQLRQQAATELVKPLDQRGQGIAERWTAGATALIDLLEARSAALSTAIRMVDPVIAELAEVKKASWAVRDNAGLARNMYGEALLKSALPPAQRDKMIDYEGRIDAAWAQLADLTSRPGEPGEILDVIKKARAEYFDRLQPLYVAIRTNAAAGKPGPLAVDEMMKSTTDSLALLMRMPETAVAATVAYAERRHGDASRRLFVELAIFIVALLVGAGGISVIRRRVVQPIADISGAMQRVAEGNLSGEIPFIERRDEIGELASALGIFKANALEKERLAEQQRELQALREKRQAAIEAAIVAFEAASDSMLSNFADSAASLTMTSQSMSVTAEETTRQANAVAAASDLTSMNVQTVAGATEQLSSSIDEIGRQVAASARIADRAVSEAKRTDATVAGLSNATTRIGDVLQIIQDIASQTNLLALNATIEAARAGDAGKGFAVVAGEVKTLANQTARATDDIAEQIKAMQTAAEDTVSAIRGIGGTIGEINGIATAIASAVEQQGAATRDIAQNVQQASVSVNEVSANIAGVSQAANEAGGAASEVMDASSEISRQAAALREHVASFLERIRSA